MEINVKKTNKIIEVWLTREETGNTKLQEQLKPFYKQWKSQNYLVAVFESGQQDLYTKIRDLLCYNRKRIAQLEVEQKKRIGVAAEV